MALLDAFYQHDFAIRELLANGLRMLIFRRIIAVAGIIHRREFDNDIARAPSPFERLLRTATGKKCRAVTLKGGLGGGYIALVPLRVTNIDTRDPVCLGHYAPPAAAFISAMIERAAAFLSTAWTTGRPTTRWLAPSLIAPAGVTTRFWSP